MRILRIPTYPAIGLMALTILACIGTAAQAAYVEVRTYVNNAEYRSRQSPWYQIAQQTYGPATLATGWITGGDPMFGLGSAYGTARAAGRADFGELGLEAQSVSGFAKVYVGYSDTWTLRPLDDSLTSQGAWIRQTFSVTGAWENWGSIKLNNKSISNPAIEDGTFSGSVSFEQYVVLGEPFTQNWWLIGATNVPTNPSAVDYLDTARLTGLQVLVGGLEFVDYRLIAESGHDYGFGQPVPAPMPVILLGSALLALAAWKQRPREL